MMMIKIKITIIIDNYDFSTIPYRCQYQRHFSVETGEMLAESKAANTEELHSAYH